MITSVFEKSNAASNEAILCFTAIKYQIGIADAKYTLGSVLYKSNSYHKGLIYLIEALPIYKSYNDLTTLSKVEKATGTSYEYLGDTAMHLKLIKVRYRTQEKPTILI